MQRQQSACQFHTVRDVYECSNCKREFSSRHKLAGHHPCNLFAPVQPAAGDGDVDGGHTVPARVQAFRAVVRRAQTKLILTWVTAKVRCAMTAPAIQLMAKVAALCSSAVLCLSIAVSQYRCVSQRCILVWRCLIVVVSPYRCVSLSLCVIIAVCHCWCVSSSLCLSVAVSG